MTRRFIYLITLFIPVFFLLESCINEELADGDGNTAGQRATVCLQLGVDGGLQTKVGVTKAASDEYLTEGELIHSLHVFIVDEKNYIEKIVPFSFTEEQQNKMKLGNLSECISDEFELLYGTYKIYAFANCDKLPEMASVLALSEGMAFQNLPSDIGWNKTAFLPNETNGFIPMSAMTDLTVNSKTVAATVELARLLSKVLFSFHNTMEKPVEISSFSLGKFHDRINLFIETSFPVIQTPWMLEKSYEPNCTIPANSNESDNGLLVFYVTPSYQEEGFELNLYSNNPSQHNTNPFNVPETRKTSTKLLRRNHVWPIEMHFSAFILTLDVKGENPPIGGYPNLTTDFAHRTLLCPIKGGGSFKITPTLASTSGTIDQNDVKWEIIGYTSSIFLPELAWDSIGKVIIGRMAGSPVMGSEGMISTATFTLRAIRNSTNVIMEEFPITLEFEDIF